MQAKLHPLCFVSHSDLYLSWAWDWSSWDLFFFSSSSLCDTRPTWTLYSTVQSDTRTFKRVSVVRVWKQQFACLLCFCSVRRVFLQLHGRPDERVRARWVHLWLHGLLSEEGKRTSKWVILGHNILMTCFKLIWSQEKPMEVKFNQRAKFNEDLWWLDTGGPNQLFLPPPLKHYFPMMVSFPRVYVSKVKVFPTMCFGLFRVSLIWVPPMLWWCLTGRRLSLCPLPLHHPPHV